ncbi:MAG TPA: hypothetical protein VGM50_13710 [Gemmatimonadaceae bacterium]|jgi:uncharacterized coiled-coil DUF342 family protein
MTTAAIDTAVDAESPLAAMREHVERLRARRTELVVKRDQAAQMLESSRSTRGYYIATGSGDVEQMTAQIATLADDVDGYTRASAQVERELASAIDAVHTLEVAEARADFHAVGRQHHEELAALEARVQAFAEELRPFVSSILTLESARASRHQRLNTALRDAKQPRDETDTHNPTWNSYPDLHDVVELLEKYATGRSPRKARQHEAEDYNAAMRRVWETPNNVRT